MKNLFIAAGIAACTIGSEAAAAPTQWSVGDGGNGHYYDLVVMGDDILNWTDANAAATSSTFMGMAGHLATITSAGEQAFFDMINPNNLKTWIGGTDAAEEGTFEWVTGEAFDYTFWDDGEPNNIFAGSGGEDYILAFFRPNGSWNDARDRTDVNQQAYLIEYSVAAVPLPASLPLVALGLGALGMMRRLRKES